jgi:2'-5' RNA ligase
VKRLFFALWPSVATRKAVDKFNQTLKVPGLKTVKADNLHVTLVFLGNVDRQTERLIKQSDITFTPTSIAALLDTEHLLSYDKTQLNKKNAHTTQYQEH